MVLFGPCTSPMWHGIKDRFRRSNFVPGYEPIPPLEAKLNTLGEHNR